MREGADAALRRCEAYARAGADLLFPVSSDLEKLCYVGRRTPLSLMLMVHPGQSFARMGLSHDDLVGLNYRLLVDGITPFAAAYEALASSYQGLADAAPHDGVAAAMEAANALVDLPGLLEIEKRTTEAGEGKACMDQPE
jgi:methylisocitrate lyase